MSYIIFMDIDGTLCDSFGRVPHSAQQALAQTRQKGNKVILCTGRSKAELTAEISAIGVDGIIAANGMYIELAQKVIEHQHLPEADVLDIVAWMDAQQIGYYLESNDGLFANDHFLPSFLATDPEQETLPESARWFFDILEASKHQKIDYATINKISFISSTVPYEAIAARYQDRLDVFQAMFSGLGEDSGEIAMKNVNKKTAIETVMQWLDVPYANTFAYGDGKNDIVMFEAVGKGVAMGDAADSLKAVADEITQTAKTDGIALSFLKNKLIDSM